MIFTSRSELCRQSIYLTSKRWYSCVCISRHKYYLDFLYFHHILCHQSHGELKNVWAHRHNKLLPSKKLVTLAFGLHNLSQATRKRRCDISSWRAFCQQLFTEAKFRKNCFLLPHWYYQLDLKSIFKAFVLLQGTSQIICT